MPVRVVHVGNMRMLMTEAEMAMPVGVGLARRVFRAVLMLMVRVVDVAVRMLQRRMFMLVLMPLGEMKPDTHGHQDTRRDRLNRDWLM